MYVSENSIRAGWLRHFDLQTSFCVRWLQRFQLSRTPKKSRPCKLSSRDHRNQHWKRLCCKMLSKCKCSETWSHRHLAYVFVRMGVKATKSSQSEHAQPSRRSHSRPRSKCSFVVFRCMPLLLPCWCARANSNALSQGKDVRFYVSHAILAATARRVLAEDGRSYIQCS